MNRRTLLLVSLLSPLAGTANAAGHTFGFSTDGANFLLDGARFQIRSGEMHPARIPVQYWRHRIQMAKAMGLNTIALYLMWNYLEERPGVFDLSTDRRDFVSFIKLCQAEGMWVLLRPGPYVCGEWDLGGLPPYLLANSPVSLRVRTSADTHYMAAVTRYVTTIAPVIKPLMVANGGPVLMVQVENEYGSYGNDGVYMEELRQLWVQAGITGPFYTQDGLGQVTGNHTNVTGGAIGLSGGDASSIASCRRSFPAVPAMAGEVYPGWLTHWGDGTFAGLDTDISGTLRGFMTGNLSFNLYMVHGGTSFGYWAGANAGDSGSGYQPDITSYDYSAPITEQGRPTARYTAYRGIVESALGAPLPAVPAPIPTITRTGVTPTVYASLWDNLPAAVSATTPQPMENYGQNSGFMLYRKTLSGYSSTTLNVTSVHDYATVFLDGAYQGGISRPAVSSAYATPLKVTTGSSLALGSAGSSPTLDILVEGMGRVNFGHGLVDRKGITQQVSLANGGTLTNWRTYPLPVDEAFVAGLRPTVSDPNRPGLFFRATVTLSQTGDTYLDMSGWTKGVVWVNGHNLGRYWSIGPQQRLYCPAPWLTAGDNQILVFDLHQTRPKPITFEASLSGAHSVVNRRSGKALDVPGSSTTNGTQLIQWPFHGSANQQWTVSTAADGTSTLSNVNSGLLVDVQGNSSADGTPIIQWPANGGTNQQWRLVPTDSGYVKLVSVRTGKVIGVAGNSTADNAAIVQQTDTGDTSQQWTLTSM
ncbi:beta-galactosidase [Actinocrispum wychmicini]|uniref:Beta-galactosidase n=1 Tax=Actinocrispum wychmicini TaxID=1213861 RepID=A0A4R2JF21_9PSEU|nr:beta-galactosidase [Actinocrispum wychmicini]TCO54859.1 beta-galactosidase [Actinocrispum wychmicini]